MRPHVAVIDPAIRAPELASFNLLSKMSPLPLTHHMPGLFGMGSLRYDDASTIKGIIVMGSLASVHERLAWQTPLEAWVGALMAKRVPTLGLCYGHQMLAHMHGAKISYVFADKRKHLGFRDVKVAQTPAWRSGVGPLVASHNEAVSDLPRGLKIVAVSEHCAIDGMAHETLPIFSLQTHPEATTDFLIERGLEGGREAELKLGFGHQLMRSFLEFAATFAG